MLQLRSFGEVVLVIVGVINSPAIKEDFPFPTSYSWGTKNHLAFPAGLQIRLQHLQARCLRCTVCSAGCCPLAPACSSVACPVAALSSLRACQGRSIMILRMLIAQANRPESVPRLLEKPQSWHKSCFSLSSSEAAPNEHISEGTLGMFLLPQLS